MVVSRLLRGALRNLPSGHWFRNFSGGRRSFKPSTEQSGNVYYWDPLFTRRNNLIFDFRGRRTNAAASLVLDLRNDPNLSRNDELLFFTGDNSAADLLAQI